jgi:hypothetical protein
LRSHADTVSKTMTIRRMATRKELSMALPSLPYRQVPSDEDDETGGQEEEENQPFLSDYAGRWPRPLSFRRHQVLVLRCLLLASFLANAAFVGAYVYGRRLAGPSNPIFPQALYCASHSLSSKRHADTETSAGARRDRIQGADFPVRLRCEQKHLRAAAVGGGRRRVGSLV